MASRIKDFFLEQSKLPEACAADFWYEDHGFEASRTRDKPRYLKLEEHQTEEEFLSSARSYLSYISTVASFFRNTTMPQRYEFLRNGDAPGSAFENKPMGSGLLPRDWRVKKEIDHNGRFAEAILTLILKSYFSRGHIIDAERLFYRLFSENREVTKPVQIIIPSLGLSPDMISEFLIVLIFDVNYSGSYINDVNLREKYGVTLNEHGQAAYLRGTPKPDKKEEEEATGIANYYAAFLSFLGNEKEGVTEERSHQVEEESKLESGKLPAIFEGTLDRDAMAKALHRVMEQRGLSVRKAAAEAGTGSKDIQRIANGEATIDKSLSVLKSLGCDFFVEITPDEPK